MKNIREGRKNRKTFFGWLFKTSSFLKAYNEANKKKECKERVEYMIDYEGYSKDSIMCRICGNRESIKSKMEDQKKLDEIKYEKIYKKEFDLKKSPTNTTRVLITWFKAMNAWEGDLSMYPWYNVWPNIEKEELILLMVSQIICLGSDEYRDKVEGEFANFEKIVNGAQLGINDSLVGKKDQNHNMRSYLDYLYNKYVVPFTKDENAKGDYENIVRAILNRIPPIKVTPELEKVRDEILKKKFYDKLDNIW